MSIIGFDEFKFVDQRQRNYVNRPLIELVAIGSYESSKDELVEVVRPRDVAVIGVGAPIFDRAQLIHCGTGLWRIVTLPAVRMGSQTFESYPTTSRAFKEAIRVHPPSAREFHARLEGLGSKRVPG